MLQLTACVLALLGCPCPCLCPCPWGLALPLGSGSATHPPVPCLLQLAAAAAGQGALLQYYPCTQRPSAWLSHTAPVVPGYSEPPLLMLYFCRSRLILLVTTRGKKVIYRERAAMPPLPCAVHRWFTAAAAGLGEGEGAEAGAAVGHAQLPRGHEEGGPILQLSSAQLLQQVRAVPPG